HPRHPIGPARALVDRPDLFDQPRVRLRARRGRPPAPPVEAAGGDSQYPAHRGHPVHGLIRPHEPERRDGVALISCANQAAAFFRISFSSRSTRFSRRSRLSSSRSSLVSPSVRRPSSRSARFTQLRIELPVTSNSRASSEIGRPPRTNSTTRRRYSGAYGGLVLPAIANSFPRPAYMPKRSSV